MTDYRKTYEAVVNIEVNGLEFSIPVSVKADNWFEADEIVTENFPKALKAIAEGSYKMQIWVDTPKY